MLALHGDFGWDPRTAHVIVGTSAGSITGALLRAGLGVDDLAAWAAEVPAQPERQQLRAHLDRMTSQRIRVVPAVPRLRVPSPALVVETLRRRRCAMATALSVLPPGWLAVDDTMQGISELIQHWPNEPFWVPAVRVGDARRIVFGLDDMTTIPLAVSASCAIPSLFRPVTIDSEQFIDGASHSPTNADLLLASGVEAVIVIAPMSAHANALDNRPDRFVRARFTNVLAQERRALEAVGIDVFAFEPRMSSLKAMGMNPLRRSNGKAIVRSAYLGASQSPDFAALGALLAA